jgi:hypothetical protein
MESRREDVSVCNKRTCMEVLVSLLAAALLAHALFLSSMKLTAHWRRVSHYGGCRTLLQECRRSFASFILALFSMVVKYSISLRGNLKHLNEYM